MADAVTVNSDTVEKAPTSTKKKGATGVSKDVMEELKAQTEEGSAVESDNPYKVAGGVKLDSHDAVREDN